MDAGLAHRRTVSDCFFDLMVLVAVEGDDMARAEKSNVRSVTGDG